MAFHKYIPGRVGLRECFVVLGREGVVSIAFPPSLQKYIVHLDRPGKTLSLMLHLQFKFSLY